MHTHRNNTKKSWKVCNTERTLLRLCVSVLCVSVLCHSVLVEQLLCALFCSGSLTFPRGPTRRWHADLPLASTSSALPVPLAALRAYFLPYFFALAYLRRTYLAPDLARSDRSAGERAAAAVRVLCLGRTALWARERLRRYAFFARPRGQSRRSCSCRRQYDGWVVPTFAADANFGVEVFIPCAELDGLLPLADGLLLLLQSTFRRASTTARHGRERERVLRARALPRGAGQRTRARARTGPREGILFLKKQSLVVFVHG